MIPFNVTFGAFILAPGLGAPASDAHPKHARSTV